MQTLYERIFKSSASHLNLYVFGFLIALYFQYGVLSNLEETSNQWLVIGQFLGCFLVGPIVQFFFQTLLITSYFVVEHGWSTLFETLNKKRLFIQTSKAFRSFRGVLVTELKKPTHLLFSAIGTPLLFALLKITTMDVFNGSFDVAIWAIQLSFAVLSGHLLLAIVLATKETRNNKKSGLSEVKDLVEKVQMTRENTKKKREAVWRQVARHSIREQLVVEVLNKTYEWSQKILPHEAVLDMENQHLYEKTVERDVPTLLNSYVSVPPKERTHIEETTVASLNEINARLERIYDAMVVHYIHEHERIANRIKF